jgi:hypothetical protein
MHYDQLPMPRVLPQLLLEIHEGDTFEVCGHTFTVTQVIGEACYVKPQGVSWDRHVPKQQLQALLARIGTRAPR